MKCLQQAEADFLESGRSSVRTRQIDKCHDAVTKTFAKIERKWPQNMALPAADQCAEYGDLDNVIDYATAAVARITNGAASRLGGSAFDGNLPATSSATDFGTGSDGNVAAGVARSFVDNGDGTITDQATGLMWAKKSDDGSVHDYDDTLLEWTSEASWNAMSYVFDGSAKTAYVDELNTVPCFANHCDWRLPTIEELVHIVDFETDRPGLYSIFKTPCTPGCDVVSCSCGVPTFGTFVASSTTSGSDVSPDSEQYVGAVNMFFGIVEFAQKYSGSGMSVRAVRSAQ